MLFRSLKYYKDLNEDSNAETVQNLPSVQYHNYLTTLLDNHLLYNFDIQANNYHREEGQGATQTDFNLPISLQTSLFDEYMNISYTAYLYAQQTSFNGADTQGTEVDDGYFARNYHVISASSQLTRAYADITHVIDFGSQYILDGDELRGGFYDNEQDYCLDKTNSSNADYASRCEFYNISDIEENMQLYFSQYLYDDLGKRSEERRVGKECSEPYSTRWYTYHLKKRIKKS